MEINRTIYRLWHPASAAGLVGYIGKDKYYPHRTNLAARAKDYKCRKLYWALKKHGIEGWHVEVLQSGFVSDESLADAEITYITKFNSKNRGYNCSDGGEGGLNPSEETREKIGLAHKGKQVSAESRLKMRLAALGRKHSPETKMKISQAFQGANHPQYGKPQTPEIRAKISESLKGRKQPPRSEDHCSALSQALTGNTNSLGRKDSEETRNRRVASFKKTWANRKPCSKP